MLLTNEPVCCKHWDHVQAQGLFLACWLKERQEHKNILHCCTKSTSFFTPPRFQSTNPKELSLHKNYYVSLWLKELCPYSCHFSQKFEIYKTKNEPQKFSKFSHIYQNLFILNLTTVCIA